jgi:hypothetical protein
MSNPGINRWGLNLFWYRFWYADKNNSSVITQDDLINKLVLIYIQHGLIYNQNVYLNKYWWPMLRNIIQNFDESFNSKYFRTVEYKNRVIDEIRFYKLRTKVKNLYLSKIWILRYQNWLVVNCNSYQPFTKKNKIKKTKTKAKPRSLYLTNQYSDKNKIYYRIKFYLFFLIKSSTTVNRYYKF